MKKLLLLPAVILLSLNLIAQIPTAGLVGYYPFSGNMNDLSGSNNNAINNGATLTSDRFGNANAAYSFDGTSNYATITNALLPATPSSYSINYWTYAFATMPGAGIVITDRYGSDAQCRYKYDSHINSTNQYDIRMYNYTTVNEVLSPNKISNNTWILISIVYDLASSTLKLYENGVMVGSTPSNIWNSANNPTTIGAWGAGTCSPSPNTFFNGKIDDIRIYNRALTASEITSIFNENVCTKTVYTSVTDTLVIKAILTGVPTPNNTNTLKVFPNPSYDKITINTGNYSSMNGYSIKIMNNLGQLVYQTPVNASSYTIDLNTFGGKGLYFLNIFDSSIKMIESKKIVLQ
jgi:hypothetical protein